MCTRRAVIRARSEPTLEVAVLLRKRVRVERFCEAGERARSYYRLTVRLREVVIVVERIERACLRPPHGRVCRNKKE